MLGSRKTRTKRRGIDDGDNQYDDVPATMQADSTLAVLSLVAIILIALIFVSAVAYMIYLRCKGECPQCRTLKGQLKLWESGERNASAAVIDLVEGLSKGAVTARSWAKVRAEYLARQANHNQAASDAA